ncbi:MAG: hypothetical protein ACJ73J_07170 [Actinomycetes bacterium]
MDVGVHAALIHSPLTGAAVWGDLPSALGDRGWTVTVTEAIDDEPPYSSRFVARTAQQLHLSEPSAHLVLIGHGAAGPLLPQIAFARQASGCPVRGYVFVDAWLPRTLRAGTLLDIVEASDPAAGAELAQLLTDGGSYPDWTDRDLAGSLTKVGDRALLLASLRPHGLDFFTEPLPLPDDWPDAPCAYIQLSESFSPELRTAQLRNWPSRSVAAHHFWAVTNPSELADLITEVSGT